MGEHKHKVETSESKAIKPDYEAEQLSGYHPAGALRQVTVGPPSSLKPAQILALQRTVGNKVVQRMLREDQLPSSRMDNKSHVELTASGKSIQRHPTDGDSSARDGRIDALGDLAMMTIQKDGEIMAKNVDQDIDLESNKTSTQILETRADNHESRISNLESSGGGEEGNTGEGGRSSRSRNRTSAPPGLF